jgi:hypothetical protein
MANRELFPTSEGGSEDSERSIRSHYLGLGYGETGGGSVMIASPVSDLKGNAIAVWALDKSLRLWPHRSFTALANGVATELWISLTTMPKVLYAVRYVIARPSIASLLSVDPHAESATETARLCMTEIGREFEFMNTVVAMTKFLEKS